MRRTVLFAAALLVCTVASGESLTLADIKAKSAVQISADDLKQLLSGAKVANQIPSGSTRRWENRPGGEVAASSDGRGLPTPRVFSGSGTWNVDAKGAYCVHIQWPTQIGVVMSSRPVTSTTPSSRSTIRHGPGSSRSPSRSPPRTSTGLRALSSPVLRRRECMLT